MPWSARRFQYTVKDVTRPARGRVDADVTPNLTKVVPGANQLPIYAEPPPKAPEAAKKN